MTIGKRIAQIRILKGYTQKEFAGLINQSDKTVSKWEMDNGEPNTQSIKDICNLYGLSRDYLYDGTILSEGDKKIEKELEENKKNKALNVKLEIILNKCEKYLSSFGLKMDDDIVPFVDKENINYNCFIFKNDNVVGTSFEKLIELKKVKYLTKLHKEKISIRQAIQLDSTELLAIALEVFNNNVSKSHKSKDSLLGQCNNLNYAINDDQYEKYVRENNICSYLDGLNPNLKNYFAFIVMLVDAGAYYVKEVPFKFTEGYKIEKDFIKTNFYYAVAKKFIEK